MLNRETIMNMMSKLPPRQQRMRVIMSDAAVVGKWRKDYPKSRAKNPSHLRRMQNKWRRRYGLVMEPAILRTTDPLTEEILVFVHPMLWSQIPDDMKRLSPVMSMDNVL